MQMLVGVNVYLQASVEVLLNVIFQYTWRSSSDMQAGGRRYAEQGLTRLLLGLFTFLEHKKEVISFETILEIAFSDPNCLREACCTGPVGISGITIGGSSGK